MGSSFKTEIVIAAKDLASRTMKKFGGTLDTVKRKMFNLRSGIATLAGFAGLGFLAKSLISTGSSFENLSIQLEALEGSSEAGRVAMDWVRDFARETPLSLEGVTQAFVKAKAFGLDPMGGTMLSLVDISSKLGGGQDRLNGIVTAVGQAWTKQKLQAEEALQLIERGVPVWDLLSEAMGKSSAEIQAMATKGELGRKQIKLLIDAMGNSATGAAAANMTTFTGLWSNFMDQISQGKDEFATADRGLFSLVKGGLTVGIKKLSEFRDSGALREWGKGVGDTMLNAAKRVLLGAAVIRDALEPIFRVAANGINSVIEIFNGLPSWMKPLGLIGAILLGPTKGALLVGAIGLLNPIIEGVKQVIRTFKGELGDAFDPKPVEDTKLSLIALSEEAEGSLGSIARLQLEVEAAFDSFGKKKVAPVAVPEIKVDDDIAARLQKERENERLIALVQRNVRDESRVKFEEEDLELQRAFRERKQTEELEADERAIDLRRLISESRLELSAFEIATLEEMTTSAARKELTTLRSLEDAKKKVRDSANKNYLGATSALFNALFIIGGSKSKSLFRVTKALNIAEAVTSTYSAASKALNAGPVPNFPLAALTVAQGLANVARIKATKFGGGGGGGGAVSSGPSSGGVGGTSGVTGGIPQTFPGGQEGKLEITVIAQTLDPESIDTSRVGEAIADSLGEHLSRSNGQAGNVTIQIEERV